MDKLPPVFDKVRFKLRTPPPIVLFYPDAIDLTGLEVFKQQSKSDPDAAFPVMFYEHYWLEITGGAMSVRVEDASNFLVHLYYKNGTFLDSFRFASLEIHQSTKMDCFQNIKFELKMARQMAVKSIFEVGFDVHQRSEEPAEIPVNTKTRNEPSFYYRQGDTIRYSRITDLRTLSSMRAQRGYDRPDEPSGIRKKEHEVRGHWRHYKSGVKVWVRSHTRGDPELGKVTRVIKG